MLSFAGCSKTDNDQEKRLAESDMIQSDALTKVQTYQTNISGEWDENYKDYPDVMMDGNVVWKFTPDGQIDILRYGVSGVDTHNTTVYELTSDENGELVIISFPSGTFTMGSQGFIITRLTETEMEWQRRGTVFQEGSAGFDFKHFTRK